MKRKVLAISLFLFYTLGSVVFLTACGQRRFIGNHVVEDSFYRLDIDRMTGTDQVTMELGAGDTLAVQFETVKGFIYMEIKEPNENILYAGNGKGITEFTVNLSESGTYFIYVKAHHAKGNIYIQQVDGKKTQRADYSVPEIGSTRRK